MFTQINTIGGAIGTRVSRTIAKMQKLARGKAALANATLAAAAAVATTGLGLTSHASAAILDVQSITTHLIPGASTTTIPNVPSTGGNGPFKPGSSYNMAYAGNDLQITSLTTAAGTYNAGPLANTVINRGAGGPDTNVIWFQASGGPTSTTLNMSGPVVTSTQQAFSGNNILIGADNLFTNTGNGRGNRSDIERLDEIFPGGLSANPGDIFAIFERGASNAHDGFKIAAITGLDASGAPSDYGPLLSVGKGTWGHPKVVKTQEYLVTRSDNTIPNDPQHVSDKVTQPIGGGVVIPSSDLVKSGTTIYGYSLFATDVKGSGTQLVDFTNTSVFPTNTSEGVGGLDPLGTTAVLYTSQIPEPATATLGTLAAAAMLTRRPRRKDRIARA